MIHNIPLDSNAVALIQDIINWINNHKKIVIAILLSIPIIALSVYVKNNYKQRKYSTLSIEENRKKRDGFTLAISAICVLIAFSVPLWLDLSLSKNEPGSVILQSLLTVSGGLVILLTFMENRRKNDIDESKNIDDSAQKLYSSRHDRNTKSIELMFSSNTPAAVSAVYSLCNIADEWANEATNSENENIHKEAQSIINVLCTYIREYGKEQENPPQQEIYNKLVCKTILEELSSRLNTLDKGYTNWSDYKINLKSTTFTFPIELKNIGNTNNIDISECTFKDKLEITVAVDKNNDTDSNETEPRVLSLEGCIFNSSVSIVGNIGAKISEINLQNTRFKEKSRLEVSRLSSKGAPSPSTGEPSTYSRYIYGTQPHEMIFSYLSNAAIVVGMKYEERIAGNYEEELDYQEIPGNIKIIDCPNVSFKISDRHLVSGEVHIDCEHRYLKMFDATDCLMAGKITINAKKIDQMRLQETYIYRGFTLNCKEKIQTFYGPDAVFLFDGSPHVLNIDHITTCNTKSKVEINAGSIGLIDIGGSYVYAPFEVDATKIEEINFCKAVFHTSVDIKNSAGIKEGNFKFCSVYDRKTQKYRNFNPQEIPNTQEVVPHQEITDKTKKIADTISAIALTLGLISR